MNKILFLISFLIPMLAWAQSDTIPESVLESGEYQFVCETNCDLSEVKDNLIIYFHKTHISNSDDIQTLKNSMFLPLTLLIHNGSEIKEYLTGNMKIDFKESRIRFTLSELRIYEQYIHYDSFNEFIPLNTYCFFNYKKYNSDKKALEDKIQTLESALNSKISKKDKKEIEHQLELASLEIKKLDLSYERDTKYTMPERRKEILDILQKQTNSLLEIANSCENW